MSENQSFKAWRRFTLYAHIEIRDDADNLVAVVGDGQGPGSSPSSKASEHASLIAAAPDLLEALDILCGCLEDRIEQLGHDPSDDARVKLARAAIAKATGGAA